LFQGEIIDTHGSPGSLLWRGSCWDGLVQGLPRLALLPERFSRGEWRDPDTLPPGDFSGCPMRLAMVRPTKRHGIFVAHLSAQGSRLGKWQMMGVRGLL